MAMPQPLSRIPGPKTVHIGNSNDSPAIHRPALALSAMNVIAEWSILENFVASLFIRLLGANAEPALAMFTSLTGGNTQREAIRAVASTVLTEAEQDVFEAVMAQYEGAGRERNKLAHWVWGHCPELPDAVLLCDPKILIRNKSDLDKYVRDMDDYAEKRSKLIDAKRPTKPEDNWAGVLAYKADDFANISKRIQRTMHLVVSMTFLLMRKNPVNEGGEEFRRLSSEPEVRVYIDRLERRRRKSQLADPQPPGISP